MVNNIDMEFSMTKYNIGKPWDEQEFAELNQRKFITNATVIQMSKHIRQTHNEYRYNT